MKIHYTHFFKNVKIHRRNPAISNVAIKIFPAVNIFFAKTWLARVMFANA